MEQKYFTEEERKKIHNEKSKKYYLYNKEKILKKLKKYYKNNKEKIYKRNKNNYKNNKEKILKQKKEYYQDNIKKIKKYRNDNKEKIKISCKKYRQLHKKKNLKYTNNRRKTDINFKLKCYLRTRLYHAIKKNQKAGSAVKDLGCTIPELKLRLESMFQPGMSWDNWTYTGWHIDHIIPLSSFNLQNREEFLKANNYTNLQPLWAEDNLRKYNKIGVKEQDENLQKRI